MITEISDFFMAALRRVPIEELVANTIGEETDTILDLNRAQLQQGQTAEGNPITPFYQPITIRIKQVKGQPSDRVTLKDEGGFYEGFYGSRVAGGTELGSTDEKTDDLVEKYSQSIFGLSVASKEQLRDRLKPILQDKYKQSLR